MFKKKKTYVILTLIIVIIGGFFYFRGRKPKIQYETSIAQKGNLVRTVSVTGNLESQVQAQLAFKINGRLENINFDIGDKVTKGTMVANISQDTLSDNLRQAQAALKVQKEKYALMKRRNNLYKHEERQAQKAEVEKAEAIVAAAQKQLSKTVLYAPIDGTVIKRNIDPGENVTANVPLLTIAVTENPVIEANVPESDIVNVAINQKASVTFDALSLNEKFEAQVSEIDPASTVIQDVVYYRIKLKLTKPNNQLKVGMSTDIDINTAQKNNVVMIPERAIQTENNQKYVKVLKPDNTIKKINIQTGLSGDGGMVEVTNGLSSGEQVVTLIKAT